MAEIYVQIRAEVNDNFSMLSLRKGLPKLRVVFIILAKPACSNVKNYFATSSAIISSDNIPLQE
jgi:hypothetical protein